MLKDIAEDLILLVLIAIALYFAWNKWIGKWFNSAAETVDSVIETERAAIKTITESSPSIVLSDLWASISNPYISQEQFRQNIADIQKNLGE